MLSTKLYLSLIIYLFLFPILTHAIPPQKYCESLPATSCELLNTHYADASSTGLIGIYTFKYCRNQEFKTVSYGNIESNIQGELRFDSNNRNGYCFGSGFISISTTTLCSLTAANSGCPNIPLKKFLP